MSLQRLCLSGGVLLLMATATCAEERADLLVADFEQTDYGAWTAEGEAFGPAPAKGALPGQMPVSGFHGERLVNSFYRGDATTGTLTSPTFRIERKFMNFLMGGGMHPGQTCMNLLIDGQIVRTATGPNDRPGGSERLDWATWDVSELQGRNGVLQIVDQHTGGWGHINVDQIIQSDRPMQSKSAARELVVRRRYLHLPISNDGPSRRMKFRVGDQTVREFDIALADAAPDLVVSADVSDFHGKTLRLEVERLPPDSQALGAVVASDEFSGSDVLYREKHRPQFHFTSRRGWLNDPNGLVFNQGEWHLFYQHNPYGTAWGNMHWGHAVSSDLIHWRELPLALYPPHYGDWCFSGSAVVDAKNTSGFQNGPEPPIVAAFTSTGRGEAIVFSNDRGRTFTEFSGNPVVRHRGRDPRLLWHEPSRRWVMAVYDEAEGKQWIAFYSSPDLKAWTHHSRIEGFYECPDLFEANVDGDPTRNVWVLYAADGRYVVGDFDGREFHARSEKQQLWYGAFYAAQTFSNVSDGRNIQVGWGRGISFPGMPFNQQMTVPVELMLRTTAEGIRMFARPVRELESLYGRAHAWRGIALESGKRELENVSGDLFDVSVEIEPRQAKFAGVEVRGTPILYDAVKQQLICRNVTAPLAPQDGKLRLRILADRGSLEIFGNDGRVALSVAAIPPDDNRKIMLTADGPVNFSSVVVRELASAWSEQASKPAP